MTSPPQKYTLTFFVPPSSLSTCKRAIFAAGAGRFPGYTEVCFVTRGIGQFRPGSEAVPHIGEVGELEEVEECRVEVMCVGRETVGRAVEALKGAHPYEVVAYQVVRVEDIL